MKWTHCLIILLVARGSLADLDTEADSNEESEEEIDWESRQACLDRERQECFAEAPPDKIPKTAEELLTFCRTVITAGRCVLKVKESCSADEEEIRFMREAIDYLNTVCQDENPLFQEIASHLECIGESLQTSGDGCRSHLYRDEDNDYAHTGKVASLVEKSTVLNEDNVYCVDALFFNVCPAIAVGIHCGNKARDAVYEVIRNLDDYGKRCGEDVMTEIEPLIDVFEELIIENMNRENGIDKK